MVQVFDDPRTVFDEIYSFLMEFKFDLIVSIFNRTIDLKLINYERIYFIINSNYLNIKC